MDRFASMALAGRVECHAVRFIHSSQRSGERCTELLTCVIETSLVPCRINTKSSQCMTAGRCSVAFGTFMTTQHGTNHHTMVRCCGISTPTKRSRPTRALSGEDLLSPSECSWYTGCSISVTSMDYRRRL